MLAIQGNEQWKKTVAPQYGDPLVYDMSASCSIVFQDQARRCMWKPAVSMTVFSPADIKTHLPSGESILYVPSLEERILK